MMSARSNVPQIRFVVTGNRRTIYLLSALLLMLLSNFRMLPREHEREREHEHERSPYEDENENEEEEEDSSSSDHPLSDATITEKESRPAVTFFSSRPTELVQELIDCQADQRCHLLYHHIPKTAGTSLGKALYPYFDPEGRRYRSKPWCCYEHIMDRFETDPASFCIDHKMSIYEVWGDEFAHVMQTCQRLYHDDRQQHHDDDQQHHDRQQHHDQQQQHRFVVLVSTREPLQRTTSLIHQQCSSGYSEKDANYQASCRECHPTAESAATFWTPTFVDDTNRAYSSMAKYVFAASSGGRITDHIPLLILDSTMVTDLYARLEQATASNATSRDGTSTSTSTSNSNSNSNMNTITSTTTHKAFHLPPHHSVNPENRSICDFRMPSFMMRQLQPATQAYHDVWSLAGYPTTRMVVTTA